jgi:mRNA interferase MazF
MPNPKRGEVWLVDLGYVAKVRPCLVLCIPANDEDRALVTLVPHTTSIRGSRFEVQLPIKFLRQGGFDAQNLAKLIRKLGSLNDGQLLQVADSVRLWLGF